RHLVSAQVLRNNLPRFDLQIGVPEQHAVEVKDDALVPHAVQAHRDLISQTSTDCRGATTRSRRVRFGQCTGISGSLPDWIARKGSFTNGTACVSNLSYSSPGSRLLTVHSRVHAISSRAGHRSSCPPRLPARR